MVKLFLSKTNIILSSCLIFISFFYFGDTKTVFLLCFIPIFFITLKLNEIKVDIPKIFIYLFLIYSLNTIIIYIFYVYPESYQESFSRFYTQYIKLIFIFLSLVVGFNLYKYIKISQIIISLNMFFLFIIISGLIQFFLIYLNIPTWGINLSNNHLAIDVDLGKRINGFVGEPKTYAVIISLAFWFFFDKYVTTKKVLYIIICVITLFLLYRAGSANGFLAFLLILVTYIFQTFGKLKSLTIGSLFISVVVSIIVIYKNYIFVRESHQYILDSILNGSISISSFDDLVYLVIKAWVNESYYIIFGWGFGLIHFFSIKYIGLAKWFSLDYGYIDSNVGIISFVSNFGIFGFLILLCFFYKCSKAASYSLERSKINFLIIYSFIPIFIGGLNVIPVFFMIGYLYHYLISGTFYERL